MSISATTYRREQKGDSQYSHEISAPRPLSIDSISYLEGRGYSKDLADKWNLLEVRVKRFPRGKEANHRVIFFDEPGIAFTAGPILKIRLFRVPKDDGGWLVTPVGEGVQLFGDIEAADVVLCEGEWDALTLLSRGVPAVTTTAGAGTFNSEIAERFRGKSVTVVYDVDARGRAGAMKAAKFLKQTARELRIIFLPLPGTSNLKDITDFFFKKGKTIDDFRRLQRVAPKI